MNKRGKAPQPNLKASRELSPIVEQKISITLAHLTTNKNFTFEFFDKNFRSKSAALEQFVEFLQRLTAKKMSEVVTLSKFDECGFETLPFEQINFTPNGIALSRNAKIHVFRFGNGKFRLLGFFERQQPVLNVIGFDFDYSAYKH